MATFFATKPDVTYSDARDVTSVSCRAFYGCYCNAIFEDLRNFFILFFAAFCRIT